MNRRQTNGGWPGLDRREAPVLGSPGLRKDSSPGHPVDFHRNGLTLYEVVLSLAILLGSMAVLGQLIATGSRAATQSKLRTEAMLHCQTQMAEVVASSTPPAPVDGALLAEDAAGSWVWSFGYAGGQASPSGQGATAVSPHPDLLLLEVSVSRVNLDNTVEATATLKRYMRDPQLYVEEADRAARLAAEAAE